MFGLSAVERKRVHAARYRIDQMTGDIVIDGYAVARVGSDIGPRLTPTASALLLKALSDNPDICAALSALAKITEEDSVP